MNIYFPKDLHPIVFAYYLDNETIFKEEDAIIQSPTLANLAATNLGLINQDQSKRIKKSISLLKRYYEKERQKLSFYIEEMQYASIESLLNKGLKYHSRQIEEALQIKPLNLKIFEILFNFKGELPNKACWTTLSQVPLPDNEEVIYRITQLFLTSLSIPQSNWYENSSEPFFPSLPMIKALLEHNIEPHPNFLASTIAYPAIIKESNTKYIPRLDENNLIKNQLEQKVKPNSLCLAYALRTGDNVTYNKYSSQGVNADATCLLAAIELRNIELIKSYLKQGITLDAKYYEQAKALRSCLDTNA